MIHLVAELDNKDAAIFEFCGGGDLRNDYIQLLVVRIQTYVVSPFQNKKVLRDFCNHNSAHIDFVGRLDLHSVKSFANGESD